MKLLKNQKAFLKTIKNDKARAEQKTQFKLQNKFDIEFSEIIISGVGWGDRKEPQSLTKEVLRDLTEPKTKPVSAENVLKDFIKHCESRLNHNISLIECRDLKNSCIKKSEFSLGAKFRDKELKILVEISREVLLDMVKCGEIDVTTLFKAESEKLKLDLARKKEIDLLFPKPKGKRINLEKFSETAQVEQPKETTDLPKEFCVEITKENEEVLSKVWGDFFNTIQNCTVGRFLHTNSLFSYCTESNTKYPIRDHTRSVFAKVVSIEEFLTYIGREDLINKPRTMFVSGFKKGVVEEVVMTDLDIEFSNTIQNLCIILDKQEKDDGAFSTMGFNFTYKRPKTLTTNEYTKPTETVESKTYTIQNMRDFFIQGCLLPYDVEERLSDLSLHFNKFLDSLK